VFNRNNLIVVLLLAVWLQHFGVFDKLIDRVSPVPAKVAIVAFVLDNDAPDIDLDVEVTKAVEMLRDTHDVVIKIDETPESIASIEQGPAIAAAAEQVGGEAIVLVGDDGQVIRSTKIPPKSDEMVRWVNAG